MGHLKSVHWVRNSPSDVNTLHAVVLAVGHVDPSVVGNADAMGNAELAGAAARGAETAYVISVGAEAVHAGVAVTVGDVQLTGRCGTDVGRVVEGGLHGGLVAGAEGAPEIAVRVIQQNLVGVAVGQVDGVVGADADVVGIGGHPVLSLPYTANRAVGVEHHHAMAPAAGTRRHGRWNQLQRRWVPGATYR